MATARISGVKETSSSTITLSSTCLLVVECVAAIASAIRVEFILLRGRLKSFNRYASRLAISRIIAM
jgi:hypothetical protein